MQVPAEFAYERASTVEHALDLLARYGPEARVVAGGHSLIPMMKLRLARPEALIDINDLADLAYIRIDGDHLCVGAMTRHAQLLESALVAEHYPIFTDAERVIADPLVRNRGTIGGSLCQADPAEDLSSAFAAVHATAVITGASGTRTVPIREFHIGPFETVVGPAEILTELRVPIKPGGGSAYAKVERRTGDFAVAAAGVALWLDSGIINSVGIGLTALGAEHFCSPQAEEFLRGKEPSEDNFAEAGRIAAASCQPAADQRGPVDYKRHLAGELTERALRKAASRCALP